MTKLRLDVIGDPIEHSKSPYIHETVLSALKIPYEYRKVQVEKGGLNEYLSEAARLGISGLNLTMPHKKDIIPYLDFIDDEARLFDSVNTVKIKNGKLYGYNTDSVGAFRALVEKGYLAKDKNIVILGAGGVVSTIALKMALEGARQITILNRTLSSAEKIAEMVFEKINKQILTGTLETKKIASVLTDCDVLINGTPLGMTGTEYDFNDLSFLTALPKHALVYDLIYNPSETSLLRAAKKLGLDTLNGFPMLIYQGLLADEIFLDRKLNFDDYKDTIIKKLTSTM